MRTPSLCKRPTKSLSIPYTNVLLDIQKRSILPADDRSVTVSESQSPNKGYLRDLFDCLNTKKKTDFKSMVVGLWKQETIALKRIKDPSKWRFPVDKSKFIKNISSVKSVSNNDTCSLNSSFENNVGDDKTYTNFLDICKTIPKSQILYPSLRPKDRLDSIKNIISMHEDYNNDKPTIPEDPKTVSIINDRILDGRYAHLSIYRDQTVKSIIEKGVSISDNINNLIKERGLRGKLKECLSILSEMKQYGIEISTETYNNMLIGCMKLKDAKTSRYLYLSMRSDSISPDLRTYALMIKTHIVSDDISSAFSLYRKMERDGLKADLVVYTILIDGLVMKKQFSNAWRLYNYMRTWRLIEPDEVLFTTMIKSCIPMRNAERAINIYDEMLLLNKHPTYHTYKELINCLSYRREYFHKCFQLYTQLKAEGYKVTSQLILHLLKSCEISGNIRKARELLSEAERLDIIIDDEMYITLIKVLAKRIARADMTESEKIGCIRKVWQIVNSMINKKVNVTTKLLNAIIIVYDSGKYYDHALDVLKHFDLFNVEPDYMTYFILLRMLGPKLKDPGRFFLLWNALKEKITPRNTLMCMALEMAILSKSAKRTLEVLNEMYLAKIFPTPSLIKKLYEAGKHITQINLMINNLVTLQRKVTFEEKVREQKMVQTYLDEHSLKMSRDGVI